MASLNQIVSEIAHAIHQPNNFTTRQTIRSAVIHTFNEQIRQTYERHANVDKILMQRYRISLISVPDGDIFQSLVSTKYKVKRSKTRIPRPVRLDNNLPFVSVRTVGYDNMAIPFIKEANAQFYKALPGMCTSLSYDYINGYLYVNSNGNPLIEPLGHIVIESPFEIPNEILVETTERVESNFDNDDEFIIPEDMVERIKDVIYKRNLLNVERVTNEVPVKDDINKQQIEV
jgi:hypothetical protein